MVDFIDFYIEQASISDIPPLDLPSDSYEPGHSLMPHTVGFCTPQLRETDDTQVSSGKTEEVAEWVDRVLSERADWPWD